MKRVLLPLPLLICATLAVRAAAETNDGPYFSAMQWRLIGPQRESEEDSFHCRRLQIQ